MKEEDKGKERSKRSKIRKRKGGGIRKKRKRRRYDEKNRKRRGSKTMMRERMKRRNGRNRGRRREREKHKSKGQPHRLHKSKQNLDNHCFSSSSRWFCVLREDHRCSLCCTDVPLCCNGGSMYLDTQRSVVAREQI